MKRTPEEMAIAKVIAKAGDRSFVEMIMESTGALRRYKWAANEFGGFDLEHFRLAVEDGVVSLLVFTPTRARLLDYSIRFDANTPLDVIAAAVVAALVKEGL